MNRRLPPLNQIEAFVSAANAPNFRVAAQRCALSPAAFSRRIQCFTVYAGAPLFEHTSQGARLTAEGRRCLEELEPAYHALLRAGARIGDSRERQKVTLSLPYSMATGWLIPRLGRFGTTHPDIELAFVAQRDVADVRRGEVDCGICFSDADMSGLEVRPFLDVTCAPVAEPGLARRLHDGGRRLADCTLLSVESPHDVWETWQRATGIEASPSAAAPQFRTHHAMYESASHGLGVALAWNTSVWPYLESGRLARLRLPAAKYPGHYFLTSRADRSRERSAAKVRAWLLEEARGTPGFKEVP